MDLDFSRDAAVIQQISHQAKGLLWDVLRLGIRVKQRMGQEIKMTDTCYLNVLA